MQFQTGDVVKVKNARNGLGIYQILSHEPTSYSDEYRVYVLDVDRRTLPFIDQERMWRMSPKQFLRKALRDPELYKTLRFRRYNLTTKSAHNILRKLPINPDQVES